MKKKKVPAQVGLRENDTELNEIEIVAQQWHEVESIYPEYSHTQTHTQ